MSNLIYDVYDNVPAQRLAVARFKYHDAHIVKVIRLTDAYRAECDTCSLSTTTANAAIFMYTNGVLKLTLDGATLNRI